MVNFVYNEFKRALANKEVDLDTDDIRAIFVMSNTTLATDYDINTLAGAGTLDQCDGANHPATGKVLASLALTEVAGAAGYVKLAAAVSTFTALGAGTRPNVALILLKFQSTIAGSLPIAWIDTGGFPFTPGGGDVNVNWNAAGVIKVGA